MKAIVIYKAGDAQQLQIEERPIPALKEGWTLVKGFGINRSEIFTRQGHSPSVIFPRILGIECVGVVEATTSPTLQKGQTVVSLMGEMGVIKFVYKFLVFVSSYLPKTPYFCPVKQRNITNDIWFN